MCIVQVDGFSFFVCCFCFTISTDKPISHVFIIYLTALSTSKSYDFEGERDLDYDRTHCLD